MELLRILADFLENNKNMQVWLPVLQLLKDNSFDLRRALASLTPQKLAPIIRAVLASANVNSGQNKKKDDVPFYGTSPIVRIADKDVIYALNHYLGKN